MFSTIFFPEVLNAFEQNYPDIQTELDEFGSVRACDLVQDEKLDLAIVNMEQFNIDKFRKLYFLLKNSLCTLSLRNILWLRKNV